MLPQAWEDKKIEENMGNLSKPKMKLTFFLNTCFSLAFFVHMAFIGYGIRYPDTPSIKFYTKSFKEMEEFPISFKLCVSELANSHDRYKKFGYDSLWSFYKGIANDEGTWVGWSGHKDNSTITSVRGIGSF